MAQRLAEPLPEPTPPPEGARVESQQRLEGQRRSLGFAREDAVYVVDNATHDIDLLNRINAGETELINDLTGSTRVLLEGGLTVDQAIASNERDRERAVEDIRDIDADLAVIDTKTKAS